MAWCKNAFLQDKCLQAHWRFPQLEHFASPWSQCWRFCLQNLQHQIDFCSYFGKRGTKCNTIVVSLCFAKGANHCGCNFAYILFTKCTQNVRKMYTKCTQNVQQNAGTMCIQNVIVYLHLVQNKIFTLSVLLCFFI